MTTWRHAAEGAIGKGPKVCIAIIEGRFPICGCRAPVPATCGFEHKVGYLGLERQVCGAGAGAHGSGLGQIGGHQYKPTRCTCGHPIEATR